MWVSVSVGVHVCVGECVGIGMRACVFVHGKVCVGVDVWMYARVHVQSEARKEHRASCYIPQSLPYSFESVGEPRVRLAVGKP